jgi:hypothetical protein
MTVKDIPVSKFDSVSIFSRVLRYSAIDVCSLVAINFAERRKLADMLSRDHNNRLLRHMAICDTIVLILWLQAKSRSHTLFCLK